MGWTLLPCYLVFIVSKPDRETCLTEDGSLVCCGAVFGTGLNQYLICRIVRATERKFTFTLDR